MVDYAPWRLAENTQSDDKDKMDNLQGQMNENKNR